MSRSGAVVRWAGLIALSAAAVLALEAMRLSAALLLGPMVAGVAFAVGGARLRLPAPGFAFAQAVVGCMVARLIPLSTAREIADAWPLFLVSVASVVAASAFIGWLLARWRVLPGTSAVWGSLPGAASAMALMADAFGADARLVAFMQYTRVLVIAVVASAMSRLLMPAGAVVPPISIDWFPAVDPVAFAGTLAIAVGGAWAGTSARIPAGALLLPMVVGVGLHDGGWLSITLPTWLLAFAYALVGWGIGLRFTREILRHVARALQRVLAAVCALVGLCGLLAVVLAHYAGLDPLTAYLATSPGGVDSVAIIASTSHVDASFVMAMQTARFVFVLALGPAIARFVARHVPKPDDASPPTR